MEPKKSTEEKWKGAKGVTANKLELMNFQLKLLSWFALLPPMNAKRDSWTYRFHLLFCCTLLFWYIPMLIADTMAIPQNWGNLPLVIEVIFQISASISAMIGGYYITYHKYRVVEHFKMLETRFMGFINNSTVSEEHLSNTLAKVTKQAKLSSYLLILNVGTILLSWTGLPYIRMSKARASENILDQSSPDFWGYFCFVMWLPENPIESPKYEFLYLFQLPCVAVVIFHITGLNMIFYFTILYISFYFELLTKSLQDIDKRFPLESEHGPQIIENKLILNEEEDASNQQYIQTHDLSVVKNEDSYSRKNLETSYLFNNVNQNETPEEYVANFGDKSPEFLSLEENAIEHLKQCIKYHQSLLEYHKLANDLLSPMFLAFFMSNEISMCLSVFQILVNENSGILKTLSSGLTVCTWPFIISYSGEYLTNKGKEFESVIYDMQWYKRSEKFKKLLLMNLAGAQKPVRLSAGNFFDVSLESFAEIVNKVYAYFTIVKKMYDG
ncbi:Odorant receptor 5 [Blattella germanica]|nr:Odorant receptor 5 [Blattella germanica]